MILLLLLLVVVEAAKKKPSKGELGMMIRISPERYAFFSTRYDIDTIFGFFSRYDTISIQYFGLRKGLLFEEFSASFRLIFRILEIFRGFSEFSEFLELSENFGRKKTK